MAEAGLEGYETSISGGVLAPARQRRSSAAAGAAATVAILDRADPCGSIHSGSIPAALTMSAHFLISDGTKAFNSSGVLDSGSIPAVSSFS